MAVEKLAFSEESQNLGDRKCLRDFEKSFLELPNAKQFLQVRGERVSEVLNKIAKFLADKFEIVALVSDGAAAVNVVLASKPDVLILDIAMPEMDGIEAAMRLRDLRSSTKIIFLTAAADREPQLESWQNVGAQGHVLKVRMRSDLVLAIRTVLEGGTFFLPNGHSRSD